MRVFVWTIGLCIFLIWPNGVSVWAQAGAQIQKLEGEIENGQGTVYTLSGLKKGDVLYAFMANTSGNLDPILGIINKQRDFDGIHDALAGILKNTGGNMVKALSRFAEDYFVAWNDDGDDNYDAALKFVIPADGTYHILAGSMITNQQIDAYRPQLTSGSYRLLLGVNTPGVLKGEGEPTGVIIARIEKEIAPTLQVQDIDVALTSDKKFTLLRLIDLEPGDSLYARLVGAMDDLLPRIYLGDFGGKPLAMSDVDQSAKAVTFVYKSNVTTKNPILFVDGSQIDQGHADSKYRLTVGINAPAVLSGNVTATGSPVLKQSTPVEIALYIDQIVNVDQQSENFTIVGSLGLVWQDAGLAFSPDECRCVAKKVELDTMKSLAAEKNIFLPVITFFNQQGNRWSQNKIVYLEPSGLTTYREKFTVTLQAPDFDFRKYPFDRQQFHVRIDLAVPTEIFQFTFKKDAGSSIGDQLGEEQWSVIKAIQHVTEVPFDKNLKASRFTMTMEVKRHLNFYIYRIFFPLFLIIGVSWVIFFLKDYGRQLEVASGNLLVFVAFNFTISDDLPRLGYLTLLDRLIIASFACAALVVFISVFQKRLEASGNKALAVKIDNWVLILYPLIYVLMMALEFFMTTR